MSQRNGHRFKKGDIVYWCQRKGHEFKVKWGMVYEHYLSAICIDYLSPKETRLINGIPIDEFEDNKYKKLPKGWSYDTKLFEITYDDADLKNSTMDIKKPETIKSAYERGLLVKDSTLFHGEVNTDITKEGYRVVLKYPPYLNHISSTSVTSDKLYYTYEEAKKEVDANVAEFHRQANLSEYDWSVEQIDKELNRWQHIHGETDNLKNKYREWLLGMDNVEDIETRVIGGEIQWKYWKKQRWNNIDL